MGMTNGMEPRKERSKEAMLDLECSVSEHLNRAIGILSEDFGVAYLRMSD